VPISLPKSSVILVISLLVSLCSPSSSYFQSTLCGGGATGNKYKMDLAIANPFVPIMWSVLLMLCQQVYQMTQNLPRHRIIIEVGQKVQAVHRILERLARRGPSVTDPETMANVENGLNAIRDEITGNQRMTRTFQNNLKQLVQNLQENVQLLSTNLVVDIHERVMQDTRLEEAYARLAAENASLRRQVVNSEQRREEVDAHVPTMQQSVQGSRTEQERMHENAQGNSTLAPYIMIKQDKTPLVPYCIPVAECLGSIDLDSSSENRRPYEIFEAHIPFIHGFHTCDACSTKPIVGKRFHAVHIPNYDMCQTCFESQNWTSGCFMEEERDGDRPFQPMWRRRLQRMESF
jgi:Zinc finger, ZZ type